MCALRAGEGPEEDALTVFASYICVQRLGHCHCP